MTCSWEEKRFSPELRESTMLSCWQKEPSTIRSVRKRDVSITFWGALSEILMICLPLLATSGTTLENFCASPLFVVQIWRRSRHTSTPSGMELPHMAAEALVRNMFCRGNYRNGFCFFVFCKNKKTDKDVILHRPGESLHALPGSPQRPADLHVPTWPQAPDTLNLPVWTTHKYWWRETIVIHNQGRENKYRS